MVNFIIMSGMVCSSFLINVCMLIVSKYLLISRATVIVRVAEPFDLTSLLRCYLLCVVHHCIVVCTRVAWVCFLLCKEKGSSPVSLQLLRGGIWACMRCPCLCLCWVLGWRLC